MVCPIFPLSPCCTGGVAELEQLYVDTNVSERMHRKKL